MRTFLAPLLLSLCLTSPATFAEEEEAPDFADAALSGNWGGQRSTLWQAGWALDAALRVDAIHSRGGQKSGAGAMTNLDLRVKADLAKILDWNDATAYLHILDNRGAAVNADYTGSFMGVSSIEVPVAATRIYHAWLQQNFFNDQFSLLAGIYPIDAEFFVIESAGVFAHPTFGTPGNLAITHGPAIFNNGALALRAKWLSKDRTLYGMAAILDGVPNDPERPKQTTVKLGDGAFLIGEFGWTPLEYGHSFEPVEPVDNLPSEMLYRHERYGGVSKYAIGAWRYTSPVADQFNNDADGQPGSSHSQGAYVLAERTLFGLDGSGRDVSAFARYSLSDGRSTPLDRSWNIGLRVRGPLASRPEDVLALGWVYARLAPDYRAAQAAGGNATASSENVVELTWRAQFSRYFAIQPLLQSITHPGGSAAAARATVIGARFDLVL